jgi:hypothetical protein
LSETFSTLHIVITALITAAASLPVTLAVLGRTRRSTALAFAAVAGLATLGWRLAANVDALNTDGIAWVSDADALAPIITFVLLDMYVTLHPTSKGDRSDLARVAVAAVALLVNIVAI